MLDEQLVLGRLLDGARDPLAVLWTEDERTEDEHVERAPHQGKAGFSVNPRRDSGKQLVTVI